jgi:hypothetical protein
MSLLLLIASNVCLSYAQEPLSSESRNAVMRGVLKGMIYTTSFYLISSYLWNEFKFKPSPLAAAIWASLGGSIGGSWAYFCTPEFHYEYAKKGILVTKASSLIELIATTDVTLIVASLKDYFFKERLPLFSAFTQLSNIYTRLQEYEESLQAVLGSHRVDLHADCQLLLLDVASLKAIVKKAMMPLKEDANFIAEYNAQTMQQMQQAQLMAAHAAESSALAQWFKPTVSAIVITK